MDCPLTKQDNMTPKSRYINDRTDNHSNSMADKVMEPLSRLFTDLVDQLKLLTPSGHSPHKGFPNYEGNSRHDHKQMGLHNGHRQNSKGNYHRQDNAQKNCSINHCHRTSYTQDGGHHQDNRDGVGNKNKYSKRPHTRIHKIESAVSVTLSAHLPWILKSTQRRRLHLNQSHLKTNFPPQVIHLVVYLI